MISTDRYASLTDYELAALYHAVATERCTSQEQEYARQDELDAIGAAMDARDVRLEDWDISNH